MDYWTGIMDWPIKRDWKCETCGGRSLTWGLVHARCRCDMCHTEYMMRDENGHVETPICRLKEEYKQPAIVGYARFHEPISKWTDDMWDEAIKAVAKI